MGSLINKLKLQPKGGDKLSPPLRQPLVAQYDLFDSIEEFKKTCEFFAAGEKIPHRIAKIKGSITSCLSFGFDTWVAKTSKGYLCAVDCSGKNGGVIVIDKNNCDSFVLIGNPYSSGGIARWVGNNKINETSWLLNINKALDEMNT